MYNVIPEPINGQFSEQQQQIKDVFNEIDLLFRDNLLLKMQGKKQLNKFYKNRFLNVWYKIFLDIDEYNEIIELFNLYRRIRNTNYNTLYKEKSMQKQIDDLRYFLSYLNQNNTQLDTEEKEKFNEIYLEFPQIQINSVAVSLDSFITNKEDHKSIEIDDYKQFKRVSLADYAFGGLFAVTFIGALIFPPIFTIPLIFSIISSVMHFTPKLINFIDSLQNESNRKFGIDGERQYKSFLEFVTKNDNKKDNFARNTHIKTIGVRAITTLPFLIGTLGTAANAMLATLITTTVVAALFVIKKLYHQNIEKNTQEEESNIENNAPLSSLKERSTLSKRFTLLFRGIPTIPSNNIPKSENPQNGLPKNDSFNSIDNVI